MSGDLRLGQGVFCVRVRSPNGLFCALTLRGCRWAGRMWASSELSRSQQRARALLGEPGRSPGRGRLVLLRTACSFQEPGV